MSNPAIQMETVQPSEEINRLRGCINDLVGVLALPAFWRGRQPSEIISSLLDVLVDMLRLDFVYARLSNTDDGTPNEMLRLAQCRNPEIQTRHVGRALEGWLTGDSPADMPFRTPNPVAEGNISIAPFRLGLQYETGLLLAASQRPDFPTEVERMLLQVTANQAVVALHESQALGDKIRAADEFERRVMERTAQLSAANEKMKTEMSERKRIHQELKKSEQRFRLMVGAVMDYAIFMLDPEGRIASWNEGAERITGYHGEEILGEHFSRFYPPEELAKGKPRESLEKAAIAGRCEEAGWRVRKDESRFWADIVTTAVRDETGQLIGFCKVVRDLTERKRAEDALRRSEANLAEGQRISHTGTWSKNASTGEFYCSQELLRIFGLKVDTSMPTHETFLRLIHPEDRERVSQAFHDAVTTSSNYESDYRIVRSDGTTRNIHALGHPVFNESAALDEYVGMVMDVTEQHRARAQLERAIEEINNLKDRLYHENLVLREEVDRSSMFEELVGTSPALKTVLNRVAKVAPMDSTVLVTGETGTGKELIARAIHKRSNRAERAFVAFSCAGVPVSLIASELFGHEKGAFTGAQQRRLGRFELAEGGTIFLDEVGELPAETQIALLRVIQEKEFERVGGSQPVSANVRIIAATNRNLEDAIAAGTFRLDLFYRLNVFPIEVPSLRERKQDISLLAEYFIKRHARAIGKKIETIDKKTLELFRLYDWPGNIRELQSVIERSVILCESEVFSVDPNWLSKASREPRRQAGTLAESLHTEERRIIEAALSGSNGRIAGRFGAAAKLGIPSSTLESKLRILQIKKSLFKLN